MIEIASCLLSELWYYSITVLPFRYALRISRRIMKMSMSLSFRANYIK